MRWLRKERRRLRRKYLQKVAHRTYSHSSYDRWLDWEFAKSLIPLIPFYVALATDGMTRTTGLFLAVGSPLALFWFFFVFITWLQVLSRHGDKTYMLVTRKKLAKEYRE